MTNSEVPLFALAERRLAWLDQRMQALAGNIANADTPRFLPRDVAPFAATLGGVAAPVAPARDDPRHLSGSRGKAALVTGDDGERAPDGNGVSLEREMLRMAQTDADNELAQQIYKKYLGMLRSATGR